MDVTLRTDVNDKNVKRLPLLANFSWTFIGNGVYAVTQWGMLMAIAKLGSPSMVGLYSLSLAITAPIMLFCNLQLRGIQATDVRGSYEFGHYLSLRLITILAANMIIISVLGFERSASVAWWIVLIIGAAKSFEAFSDIIYGLYQRHERMNYLGVSLLIKGILSCSVLVSVLKLTNNIVYAVMGQAVSWLILAVFYDLRNACKLTQVKLIIDNDLFKLSLHSLPLGIMMMIVSLNANIPRYFIAHDFGHTSLGYFGALSYIITAGNTVVMALGQAVTPQLARCYALGQKEKFGVLLLKVCLIGCAIGLIGIVVAVFWGGKILSILYKPDYAKYHYEFVLIMVSAGCGYVSSFLGYGMTAARCFRIQPVIFGCVAVITTLASAIMIPGYGLLGASYTLVISGAFQIITTIAVNIYIYSRCSRQLLLKQGEIPN